MKKFLVLLILLLLNSCSSPYMIYTADIYFADETYKNAYIKDYGKPGELFFYDTHRVGHFISGPIEIRNSTDTTFIK